jgi:putative FmdB family regulatory protein
MPNYDFRCDVCGHTFEKNVPMNDRDRMLCCPVCVKGKLFNGGCVSRLPAAPGFSHLMGGPKVPEGFKDVLRRIKKNNAGSLIDDI